MNTIEFLVRLKDLASGPLQKLGQVGQQSFTKMETAVTKFQTKISTLSMNLGQINARMKLLEKTREISFDTRQIRRINAELETLQRKKNRLEGGGGGLLKYGLLASIAFAGVTVGKDVMQAGIKRQMDLTAMQTMVGAIPGAELNKALLNYSLNSTYGPEVMEGGKMMLGGGVNVGAIPHVIKMMGDVAQGNSERLKSLMLAFTESQTRGNLSGITERMFIQGGLFNPIQQLHLMTGKSLDQLRKDEEKGKIGIDELTKAFEFATQKGGRWYNAMNNIMAGPAGKWIAFTTNIKIMAGDIGLKLLPVLGGVTNVLNWIINHAGVVAVGIGAMTTAWLAYTAVTKGAAISAAILEAFTSPWMALAGIGIASAAVAAAFMDNADGMATSATNAANKIDKANKKITSGTDQMAAKLKALQSEKGGFWTSIGDWLGEAIKDIWWFLQKLILEIVEIGSELWRVLKGLGMMATGNFSEGWKEVKAASMGIVGFNDPDDPIQKFIDNLDAKHDLHKKLRAAGKNDDGTPLDSDPTQNLIGKLGAGGGGGGVDTGGTTEAITGGGVRNITINVQKPFTDRVEIHSINLREGVQEIEEIFRDMFLRITNSAATALK